MTYASQAALVDLVGEATLAQISNRAAVPTGTVDADAVARALASADATIDASLAVRYRLPLAAVPPAIAELAAAIALYRVHRFKPDDKVQADYDQALRDLKDIASGAKRLDLAGVEPASSGAEGVIYSDRERDLTPDTLGGFI